MKNNISLVLSARKILSVNSIYAAKIVYRGSRQIPTIYKSGEAKKTEEYIKEQIRALDVSNNFPWITKDTKFKMTIKIVFSSGFLLRDLDNTLKLVQDGIFRALDINDSHVIFINASKLYYPGMSDEKIYVNLEECYEKDFRLDINTHPENIYNQSDLIFEPIPKRKKKGVRYFRDVDHDNADTYIYVLDPDTITPDKYNDCLQDLSITLLNNVDRKFAYLGVLRENDWGDKTSWIEDLMKRFNESNCNRVKAEYIKNLEDILVWLNQ